MDGWDFVLEGTPCNVVYDGLAVDQIVVRLDTISRVHVSSDMCELFPAANDSGFQSFLGLPLWSRDGGMVGHVATFFKEPLPSQNKAEQMLEIMQILARRAEAELDQLLLEDERNKALLALEEANQRLFKESMTNPLTGRYNCRYFTQRCVEAHAHAQRTGRPYSVLAVDIDKFKVINDNYGHEIGDHVLCRIAQLLTELVRQNIDVVARFGRRNLV